MTTPDEKIILGLDIPNTVRQINADLKKLQSQLNQVKTTASLETVDTIRQLSRQITTLQKQVQGITIKPKVDVGIDTGQIKKIGQQLGSALAKHITDGMKSPKGSELSNIGGSRALKEVLTGMKKSSMRVPCSEAWVIPTRGMLKWKCNSTISRARG